MFDWSGGGSFPFKKQTTKVVWQMNTLIGLPIFMFVWKSGFDTGFSCPIFLPKPNLSTEWTSHSIWSKNGSQIRDQHVDKDVDCEMTMRTCLSPLNFWFHDCIPNMTGQWPPVCHLTKLHQFHVQHRRRRKYDNNMSKNETLFFVFDDFVESCLCKNNHAYVKDSGPRILHIFLVTLALNPKKCQLNW